MHRILSIFTWFIDLCSSGQDKLMSLIAKICPKEGHNIQKLSFSWEEYRNARKLYHFILSFFIAFSVIIIWKTSLFIPGMQHSVLTGIAYLIGWVFHFFVSYDIAHFVFFGLLFFVIFNSRKISSTVGNIGDLAKELPQFAMNEEIIFRQGAEKWSFLKKVRSCISFGLIHISMLVVPFGLAIGLIFLGITFMSMYLFTFYRSNGEESARIEKSLKAAATFHGAFNQLGICLFFISLVGNCLLIFLNPDVVIKIGTFFTTSW